MFFLNALAEAAVVRSLHFLAPRLPPGDDAVTGINHDINHRSPFQWVCLIIDRGSTSRHRLRSREAIIGFSAIPANRVIAAVRAGGISPLANRFSTGHQNA